MSKHVKLDVYAEYKHYFDIFAHMYANYLHKFAEYKYNNINTQPVPGLCSFPRKCRSPATERIKPQPHRITLRSEICDCLSFELSKLLLKVKICLELHVAIDPHKIPTHGSSRAPAFESLKLGTIQEPKPQGFRPAPTSQCRTRPSS